MYVYRHGVCITRNNIKLDLDLIQIRSKIKQYKVPIYRIIQFVVQNLKEPAEMSGFLFISALPPILHICFVQQIILGRNSFFFFLKSLGQGKPPEDRCEQKRDSIFSETKEIKLFYQFCSALLNTQSKINSLVYNKTHIKGPLKALEIELQDYQKLHQFVGEEVIFVCSLSEVSGRLQSSFIGRAIHTQPLCVDKLDR